MFHEFFNPVLSNSKYYRRFGGIFSAKRFALAAEGLQDFIKENRGTMELAIIPGFSDEDKRTLLEGSNIDDLITKNWIQDLTQIKEKILEDHVKAISWMIANNYLTIKIILPENNGIPLTKSEINEKGILKKEIGVFYNKDDDSPLSFHGIIDRDDSQMGELYSLDVSRKWIDSEREQIDIDHEDFTNYWNDDVCQLGDITCKIRPLSTDLLKYFKETAPKSREDIPELRKLPILRKYQVEAIDTWLENDGRGIFEMATGTGKTFTAIGGIKRIQDREQKSLIVVTVPYNNLIDQWKRELSKWFISARILGSVNWKQILRDEVDYLNNTTKNESSVIIVSHDLFSSSYFVEQIEKCKICTLLVLDEAHHAGAPSVRKGLSKHYHYRMALAATIERYFDEDGTNFLRDYFQNTSGNSTVFEYSLDKAIHDGLLCKYNYYPFFIQLTEEEITEYQIMTYQAAKLLNSKDREEKEKGEIIIQKRAKIVRDAKNKTDCIKQILKEIPKLDHMLIFCSENQFTNVEEILNHPARYCGIDKSLMFRKITYDNPSDKKKRTAILDEFANGDWDMLLSNRILDEGMDIPQAKICVIMASTGNPTQFIQRRGRVLRTYSEQYPDGSHKTHADIFDILVKPQVAGLDDSQSVKLETGIVKSQMNRIRQMSRLAINRDYCEDKIKEFTADLPL